jgi:hypothetical protein
MYNPRVPELTSQKKAAVAPFPRRGGIRQWSLTVSQEEREKIMAKTVCKLLGVVFVIVGIAGFVAPTLLGAHLTMAHNLVHIVSGAIALYFGFAGSASGAKGFCLIFGIVYLLLGVCGWFLGAGPDHMWHIGTLLMLGKVDHIIHILLGVVFLAGGLLGGREG